jgi:hypothetical protein
MELLVGAGISMLIPSMALGSQSPILINFSRFRSLRITLGKTADEVPRSATPTFHDSPWFPEELAENIRYTYPTCSVCIRGAGECF